MKRFRYILISILIILFILSYDRDTDKLRGRVEDFAYQIIEDKNYRSWNENTIVKEIFPISNAIGDTKGYVVNLETDGKINGNIEIGVVFGNLISSSTEEDESLYTKVFPQLRDGEAEIKSYLFSKGGMAFNVKYKDDIYYTYDRYTFYKE